MMLMRLLKSQPPRMLRCVVGDSADEQIEISVIMPVFNQDSSIQEVIERIAECMSSIFELIVIDDASTDHSAKKISESFDKIVSYPNLARATLYQNSFSRFETYCDDFGIRASHGRYGLEVQADMLLHEVGFDARLIAAIESDERLAMLSGRGVESVHLAVHHYKSRLGTDRTDTKSIFKHIILRVKSHLEMSLRKRQVTSSQASVLVVESEHKNHPNENEFVARRCAGRSAAALHVPLEQDYPRNVVYVGETVMRGPLFFKMETFRHLGGLDTKRFFQGFDDHDFCARAVNAGYEVGYCPVNFLSPIQLGTTRKRRSISTEFLILLNLLRIKWRYQSSQLYKLTLDVSKSKALNRIHRFELPSR